MNLKQFRKDYGLGQKDIAEIFGCKQNHVSSIENGTRTLTPLHIRLLIEKYGFDKIAQYASADELPAKALVEVNAPVIAGNEGPVQNGNGNSMEVPNDTAALVALMNKMLDQHEKQLQKRDEQIDRLIDILEKK